MTFEEWKKQYSPAQKQEAYEKWTNTYATPLLKAGTAEGITATAQNVRDFSDGLGKINGGTYLSADEAGALVKENTQKANALLSQVRAQTAALQKGKDGFISQYGAEQYGQTLSALTEMDGWLSDLPKNLTSLSDYWGQFESREQYDEYLLSQKFGNLSYAQVQAKLKEGGLTDAEKTYLTYYGYRHGYSNVADYDAEIKDLEDKHGFVADTAAWLHNVNPIPSYITGAVTGFAAGGLVGAAAGAAMGAKGEYTEKRLFGDLDTVTADNSYAEALKKRREALKKQEAFETKYVYVESEPDFAAYVPERNKQVEAEALAKGVKRYSGRGSHVAVQTAVYPKLFEENFSIDDPYRYITDEQRKKAAYIYEKYGIDAGDEYMEDLRKSVLQARANGELQNTLMTTAEKAGILGGAGLTLGSVATNLANGLMLPAKIVSAVVGEYDEALDTFDIVTSSIRQGRGKAWDNALGDAKIPVIDAKVGSTMYGAITSMLDMAAAAAIAYGATGVAPMSAGASEASRKTAEAVILTVMSSEAASSAFTQAKADGASDFQAIVLGLSSGVIEWITEKFSVEALFNAPDLVKGQLAKSIAKTLAQNTLAEGSEEIAAGILNGIVDRIVMGDAAAANRYIAEAMAHGATYRDAMSAYLAQFISETATEGIAGAISGFALGGATTAINASSVTSMGGRIKKSANYAAYTDEIVKFAQQGENEETKALANKVKERLDNKQSISDGDLGGLYFSVLQETDSGKVKSRLLEIAHEATATAKAAAENTENTEDIAGLIESGLESPQNTESYKLAQQYKAITDEGKTLSQSQIRALVRANDRQIREENINEVHLRDSSERNAGENTGETVRELEKETGRDEEEWTLRSGSETGESVRGSNQPDIRQKLDFSDVSIVEEQNFNAEERKWGNIAKQNGYTLVPFVGGYIKADGNVRGLCDTSKRLIYAKADAEADERVTANDRVSFDKIVKHELTHAKIAAMGGIKKIIKQLRVYLTEETIHEIAELYGMTYNGCSEDELVEEFICDAFADIDISHTIAESDVWQARKEDVKAFVKSIYRMREQAKIKTPSAPDSGVKYLKAANFADEVDKLNQYSKFTHLCVLENTPKVYLDIGLKNLPMLITRTHAKTAVGIYVPEKNSHSISTEEIKKLPALIKRPAMVMESATRKDAFVAVLNLLDKNKNFVVAPIHPDEEGNYYGVNISANIIASVYGKDSNPQGFIERAAKENRIRYFDKKMSQELFKRAGLQLSVALESLDSNTSISKNEDLSTENSKKFLQKFSRGATAADDARYMELAKEPEKNKAELEKMVQAAAKANGYTRLMYHGSRKGDNIQVFKNWQFFTENKEYAARYAEKRLYNVYVKMENVFDTRLEECRDIFYDARSEYGLSELTDNGLPDWTDGYDIADMLDSNGYDYDAVILNEGGDMVNGEPVSRGPSYMVKESNNIKSADTVTYDEDSNVIPLSKRFDSGNSNIKYSRQMTTDGRPVVVVNDDILRGVTDKKEINKIVKNSLKHFKKVGIAKQTIHFTTDTQNEYLYSRYSERLKKKEQQKYLDKMALAGHPHDIVYAITDYVNEAPKHARKDNIVDFARGELLFDVAGRKYSSEAVIGFTRQGICELHDIVQIHGTDFTYKKEAHSYDFEASKDDSSRKNENLFSNSIRENETMSTENFGNDEENSIRRSLVSQRGDAETQDAIESKLTVIDKKFYDSTIENGLAAAGFTEKDAAAAARVQNLVHSIASVADELKAYVNRKYAQMHNIPVNILADDYFKSIVKTASTVFYDGKISKKKVRESIAKLGEFFTSKNQVYKDWLDSIEQSSETVLESVEREIDILSANLDSDKELSVKELVAVDHLLKLVRKMYRSYDNYYEDGKQKSLSEDAKKYTKRQQALVAAGVFKGNALSRFMNNRYLLEITTPTFVAAHLDGHLEDGFFTKYVDRFQRDSVKMQREALRLTEGIDTFLKSHKRYARHLKNDYIDSHSITGYKICVGEAMDVWLMSTQKNGYLTLVDENGGGALISIDKKDKSFNGTGVMNQAKPTVAIKYTQEGLQQLYDSFSQEDKEFIKKLKLLYAAGGELKKKMDLQMMGFSNVVIDEYYSLTRTQSVMKKDPADPKTAVTNLQSLNNLSINKSRSKHAMKIALQASDVYEKALSYVHKITLYSSFAQDFSNFNRVLNKDVGEYVTNITGENNNQLKLQAGKSWGGFDKYFADYLGDIQGIKRTKSTKASEILGKARSNYAIAGLGINVPVMPTQFASYPTAGIYLDADLMTKGLLTGYKGVSEMDIYSDAAYIRAHDMGIAKAEALTDKISEIGQKTLIGIEKVDRFTIGRIWATCQLQVARNHKGDNSYAFGTPANKYEAGKLLDKVISRTQPTYQAADRSEFQRSTLWTTLGLNMFKSVITKEVTELLTAADRVVAYSILSKAGVKKTGIEIKSDAIKQASKTLLRTVLSIEMANLMYAVIKAAARKALGKDKDEDYLESVLKHFVSANTGMFPIVDDVYQRIASGFDITAVNLDMLNEFIDDVTDVVKARQSGNEYTLRRASKNILFTVGKLLGLPIGNLYTLAGGTLNAIDQAWAYEVGSVFYKPQKGDLDAALEKHDMRLAHRVCQKIMASRGVTINEKTAEILTELYSQGYQLPSVIGRTVSIDGESVTLTENEYANALLNYQSADLSKVNFAGLDEKQKARAVELFYQYYKDKALSSVGRSKTKLQTVAEKIPIETLAPILAIADEFDGKVNGKTVSGSKKKKISEYLNEQVLTESQKTAIMEYYGY